MQKRNQFENSLKWLYPAEMDATMTSFGILLTISSVTTGFANHGKIATISESDFFGFAA